MAEDRKKRSVPAECIETFVDEERADRRILGIACILSLLLHVPLLWIPSPFQSYDALAYTGSQQKSLFHIRNFLYRPPPQRSAYNMSVPIPDPTPDEPEPLLMLATPQTIPTDHFQSARAAAVRAYAATTGEPSSG